jgi:DNA topoisomerase-2
MIQLATIGLSQEFLGSNNVPLFKGIGSYGTADEGGHDHSQFRYLKMSSNNLLPLIFRAEDDQSLKLLIDEGKKIEPNFMLPILPYILFNGCNNVASGWKSFIHNCHPMEVSRAFRERIGGKQFVNLMPWWRGFTGEYEIVDGESKKDGTPKKLLITTGVVAEANEDGYTLTGLPIGKWYQKYKTDLIKMVEKGEVKSFDNLCTDVKVKFVVRGLTKKDEEGNPQPVTIDDIKIKTKYGLNNIASLNEHGKPILYRDIAHLEEEFYIFRLPYYDLRKRSMIRRKKIEISHIEDRIKYINAINNGKLIITFGNGKTRKASEIISDINKLGLNV